MSLRAESDIEVVGEAVNGLQAIEMSEQLVPRIVVMDVRMPVMDGLTATARIVAQNPQISVVILTMHDDRGTRERALRVGAAAVVGKQMVDGELLAVIRDVILRGETRQG